MPKPKRTDRIDFRVEPAIGQVLVTKYVHVAGRDEAHGPPYPLDTLDLEDALAWCEEHDYTVYRWPNGARAFRGTPWPIRGRRQISRLRQRLDQEALAAMRRDPGRWDESETLLQYDLAYCL